MNHPIVGALIIILSLVLTAAALAFKAWKFRRRWDVTRYGGVLVRFDRGAQLSVHIGRALMVANHELRGLIGPKVDWRVEVVPPWQVRSDTVKNGKLASGEMVGGSVRTERGLPFTKPVLVAVVVNERTDRFLAHEVCRHIVPLVLKGTIDRDHQDEEFAALELEAKKRIAAQLGRV